jgi:peptide deformylase
MSAQIIVTPNPLLRERARKVSKISDETHKIIKDMVDCSLDWEKSHPHELSAAMAAPQIGHSVRIIILRDSDDKKTATFTALINPEIIRTDGADKEDFEGCLSVPNGIYGKITRPSKVKIKALLEDGTEVRLKADGWLARTILHEIDHLDGVLFIDHIKGQKDKFYVLDDKGDLQPLDYDKHIAGNKDLFPDD